MFFNRAPDAPAPAAPDQAARFRGKPIRDLGRRMPMPQHSNRHNAGYEDS